MGSDPRRKQKQKLKRQAKRAQVRRAQGNSPYSKLKHAGEIEACYINADWREQGMASVLVLRRVPGGHALGGFLVDMLCVGLKDAWGRIDIGMAEFRETLSDAQDRMEMVRLSPEEAWGLIAGSVRFARKNGFRLPPRYERWTGLLGPLADCENADISDFGDENGGLVYIGRLDDLRRRLVGSLDEFLARPDVKFISPDLDPSLLGERHEDGPGIDAEDDEEMQELAEAAEAQAGVEEAIALLRSKMLDAVRSWLFRNSIPPHPRLGEGVDIIIESTMQCNPDMEEPPPLQDRSTYHTLVERFLSTAAAGEELRPAVDQISMFMQQFDSVQEMIESVGLEDPDEEQAGAT